MAKIRTDKTMAKRRTVKAMAKRRTDKAMGARFYFLEIVKNGDLSMRLVNPDH